MINMLGLNEILFLIFIIVTGAIWGIGLYNRSRIFLHMIQLEGYKNEDYIHWVKEYSHKAFSRKINLSFYTIAIISIIFMLLTFFFQSYIISISYGAVWAALMILSIDFKKEDTKKDLVFTSRAKRLFVANFVVGAVELGLILSVYISLVEKAQLYYPIVLFTLTLIYYYSPYNMYLGNIIAIPVEKRVNRHYYEMAYTKIRSLENLKIVGITGSYGKTSTKYITSKILEEKFKTIKTPESYNTSMGISKVINNTLTDEYEAFIVEMGAKNIGDIHEVAKLSNPQIGVITSIGPTHLDTFVSVENIMKTKYELIEELPADGIAIFNYDNEYSKRLADKTFKEKILYGMENIEDLDLFATDIEVSKEGSVFTLNDKAGNSVACKTKLLGRHNISNILAGAAIGKAMGVSMEEIATGISKVDPVPHRLNIMNPATGVIVIDDTFNSNPVSSKAALEVLNQFNDGKKIIITPGMIELGEDENKENRTFGKNIAKICDYVILIGKNRTKPIYEGIMEEGFSKDKIFVVNNLDEATNALQGFVKPKDAVLFENDLPDTFNE